MSMMLRSRHGVAAPLPRDQTLSRREQASMRIAIILRNVALSCLACAIVVCGYFSLQWLMDPQNFPIRQVQVEGSFDHVTAEEVRDIVNQKVDLGFFGLSTETIKEAVTASPWIKAAEVRAIWPDTLSVRVYEHQPLARWRDSGLLNMEGQLFFPPEDSYPSAMVVLGGPERLAAEIAQSYRQATMHLQPLGLQIVELTMDERLAWSVRLNNGIELVLGRSHDDRRLERFYRYYRNALAARVTEIERIDLRYPNGFVVKWRADAASPG